MQDSKTISGSIVHITDGAEADARAIVVEIEPVQSGSGTPSPSNVRPITGWDDVSVSVTGVNVWNEEWEVGTINASTGADESSSTRIRSKTMIPIKPNTNYCFRYSDDGSGKNTFRVCYYDSNEQYISGSAYFPNGSATFTSPYVFTTPDNAYYMRFSLPTPYGTTYNNDVSINYPSTDTAYHACNGNNTTTTTTLPSTTYGGTIDLVSGVLTVTHAMVDLGSLTWSHIGAGQSYARFNTSGISSTAKRPSSNSAPANAICERYAVAGASSTTVTNGVFGIYTNGDLAIKDNSYTSASDFKTAMNGVQLVYELATPTTAQLTGQQIELLRDCFVWADAGDITLTYETELLDGRFHKIKVNDNSIIAPNNFELEREDVYTAEYTTCTGKLIADKIGWKYADTTMQWDTLPDDMLAILTGTTGAFTLKFTDSDGSHTENVIRLGVRNTATRFTDDFGNALWRNIELEVSFTNVH